VNGRVAVIDAVNPMMMTPSAKNEEVEHAWFVADAEGKVLGRFASEVAKILRGKHKAIFTPHVDTGDHVVIINADKIQVKGVNKPQQKVYTRYSGYPGGLKKQTYADALEKRPTFVLEHAIKGMLPHNRLGRQIIKKLRIYAGGEHPHEAQNPQILEV
jgi:large subunit ribosomal protein L13